MHVLFDQGTPVQIRRSLKEHAVKTAREQGWSTLNNGDLLRAAEEAGFDAILTTDKNMRHQQNLAGRRIALIVLGNGLWPLGKTDASPGCRCSEYGKTWELHGSGNPAWSKNSSCARTSLLMQIHDNQAREIFW